MKTPRRTFLARTGATAAGLLLVPSVRPFRGFLQAHPRGGDALTRVALTRADSYDRAFIKERVQHLFESLGGVNDLMHAGQKVGIKLNLTGGSGSASSPKLNGKPLTEAVWPHPEIFRAVGELILDCGVSAASIYFVEALWDDASFNNFGYRDVQSYLGAQKVNLNARAPYSTFVQLPVGSNKYYYDSFTVNQVLSELDVYVSIPKMKEHYEAGVTASLKNQVGMVPKDQYTLPTDNGRRGALHGQGGPSSTHLPRSICDLNLARPVHLAVIDGVKNARGGEGTWNPTFRVFEDRVLIAGKEPVAADSVASYLMGHDPESPTFTKPDGGQCDNHLDLLHARGVGTNRMAEIEAVGDGADLVTSADPPVGDAAPARFDLEVNYPNPFNPTTTIRYHLPVAGDVSLTVHDALGRTVAVLVHGRKPSGVHEAVFRADGLASGVYVYRLAAGTFTRSRRMTLVR